MTFIYLLSISRFTNLVRAKTPKVILYSSKAKCLLMENSPDADFECLFYSGWKLIRTSSSNGGGGGGFRIQATDPKNQTDSTINKIPPELLEHMDECRSHCLSIESCMARMTPAASSPSNLPTFPVTIGRRPTVASAAGVRAPLTTTTSNKENEPVLSGLRSFDGSVRSAAVAGASAAVSSTCSSTGKSFGRSVQVAGVGRATQKANGDVQVCFDDGSIIGVAPNSSTVAYWPEPGARAQQYDTKQVLPHVVRAKLALVPKAVEQLVSAPAPRAPVR